MKLEELRRLCKRGNYKDEICRGKCEREMMHV